MSKSNFHSIAANYKNIFWDFDGVIKESLDVKTDAFESLFSNYGSYVAQKVRNHHLQNIGISRYKKIPIYLSWVNEPDSSVNVEKFCNTFSDIVVENVVKSPWVAGFFEYINSNHGKKLNFLVTSTPQEEINLILKKLDIFSFFEEVYGAEISKDKSIKICIDRKKLNQKECLMIGDTEVDLNAAKKNNISFLLRKTHLNKNLQLESLPQFLNFL